MKHIEQLAANEAANQQSSSLEFPFLNPSNEFHFGLTCLSVCAVRCEELRSWREYAPWIQGIVELLQSFDVINTLRKQKVQAESVVVEKVIRVFVAFLNGILIDAGEDEDWRGLVEQIRNKGLVSRDVKDLVECVESTFHYKK